MLKYAEKVIGYEFKDIELLKTALTHSSYDKDNNYEKLEFLGDSILQIIVSEFLFKSHSYLQEGEMTITRAYAVCEDTLYKVSLNLGLNKCIYAGSSAITSIVNQSKSVMADIVESITGAIYLDSGINEAKTFLISNLNKFIVEYIKSGDNKDSKTKLQHIVQALHQEEPTYKVKQEKGPAHNKTFLVEVYVNQKVFGLGSGKSKKEAQQEAAKVALKKFEVKGKKKRWFLQN